VIKCSTYEIQNCNFTKCAGYGGYGAVGDLLSPVALGTLYSLAVRVPQAKIGTGLNRMRQIPLRPLQSLGGIFLHYLKRSDVHR